MFLCACRLPSFALGGVPLRASQDQITAGVCIRTVFLHHLKVTETRGGATARTFLRTSTIWFARYPIDRSACAMSRWLSRG